MWWRQLLCDKSFITCENPGGPEYLLWIHSGFTPAWDRNLYQEDSGVVTSWQLSQPQKRGLLIFVSLPLFKTVSASTFLLSVFFFFFPEVFANHWKGSHYAAFLGWLFLLPFSRRSAQTTFFGSPEMSMVSPAFTHSSKIMGLEFYLTLKINYYSHWKLMRDYVRQ